MSDPATLLARHALFADLPARLLARLVAVSLEEGYDAGAVLMEQGSEGRFATLILSGEVAVEVQGAFGPVMVATLGPGELVGELAAFAAARRSATVRARRVTRVLRIGQPAILEVMREAPELATSVIATLGARIERVNAAIATLTQATRALAEGAFAPAMLDTLETQAQEVAVFRETFRDMAAQLVEKRTLTQEMQTAAAIQRAYLPGAPPAGPGADRVRLAARMTPARNVGGDFYDWFWAAPGRLAIAVGDVSGKGIPAALFMSVARTVLKTVAREGHDAAETLTRVNAVLAEDNGEGMFVTLAFGVLDVATGAFDYASGGHEEGFHLGADPGAHPLPVTGPAVGLFETARYRGHQVRLSPGDQVLIATDGVTEAFNPQRQAFGLERLTTRLAERPLPEPQALIDRLEADVARFVEGAPASDDLTLLALHWRG